MNGFPGRILSAGTSLYRIYRATRSPWWFSSDGSGRFDLPAPAGTCYLAEQPLAALLEVTRGLTLLSEAFLNGRRLLTVQLPHDLPLADLTAARAYRYGLTAEVAATSDYDMPHAWAAALRDAGFAGVRYHVRHDPGADHVGIAWFGRAGRMRHPPPAHRRHVPAELLVKAAPYGVQVAANLPPVE